MSGDHHLRVAAEVTRLISILDFRSAISDFQSEPHIGCYGAKEGLEK